MGEMGFGGGKGGLRGKRGLEEKGDFKRKKVALSGKRLL